MECSSFEYLKHRHELVTFCYVVIELGDYNDLSSILVEKPKIKLHVAI